MRPDEDHRATSGEAICPYCGVGCRLWMEAAYGQVLRVKGCAAAPANRGGICAKGATLPQVLHTPDRLIQPHLRTSSGLRPVSWDKALEVAATQLAEIVRRHGPEAIAFYGSGQLDTEAVYVAVKLFKGALGTNNTDSNSRLCMAAAVAGYRSSLGSDGPPTCYDDLDEADLLLVVGSNMAEAHPVLMDRIRQRRRQPDPPTLVVIDRRPTSMCPWLLGGTSPCSTHWLSGCWRAAVWTRRSSASTPAALKSTWPCSRLRTRRSWKRPAGLRAISSTGWPSGSRPPVPG
jgi:anaerobic selenocysteine-containing dehydrogenase